LLLARLGEIDTILEKFSCDATLFITWIEDYELFENDDPESCEWDTKKLWDPQLVFFYLRATKYSNSSEFKGNHEIGNNSAAEFDTKFINS